MGYEKLMPIKWRGKGGEIDRQGNGRTVLRDMLEERKVIEEQHQKREGVEDC